MQKEKLFNQYLKNIQSKYSHIETSEMGYRTDFENLLKELFKEIGISRIDHDAKAISGNKPDFRLVKNDIPFLYIEVKDIGVSLDKIEISEQMSRYYGYDNLVLTDYLEFRFYRNGLRYTEPIVIATFDRKTRTLSLKPENYELLAKTLLEFPQSHKEPIKSGIHLAKVMGGKALRIRDNVNKIFSYKESEQLSIYKVYQSMKKTLIHDMTIASFADMYAQTLVYGLFVARYHDDSPENFTRQEARDLVPASNPLLRHFFDHLVGTDFDERLKYIVDELCEIFAHADIPKLMSNYYKNEKNSKDPVIHFYEDFLQEYDSEKRKNFGAYYTPLPVVQFIVRSVDKILEQDFGLGGGLANATKEGDEHKVQILDPATGTGTFLTEVIKHIHGKFANQTGRWGTYVHHDLLPRLFGFELMMAPYTIAHLKMSMLLKETGFKYFNNTRLGIYLTNSLEEGDSVGDLFGSFGLAESISQESKEAVKIKNDKPIMVVIGNPPYSVSSQNKGEWIMNLIKDYKKDLNERNIQPLSDDYIKFIRFAEHFIEKNQTGIVAMITNNSFLDGIIHRQMRKHLLETFDDIYILDLHGNSKKKEKALDGSRDENVFDIQQGVSINIFVRKNKIKKGIRDIYYSEIQGLRESKFALLNNNNILSIKSTILKCTDPYYFFITKDFSLENIYSKGISLTKIFHLKSIGIVSGDDKKLIAFNTKHLQVVYPNETQNIRKIAYRPYDNLYTVFSNKILQRSRKQVMENMLNENIALCAGIYAKNQYPQVLVSKDIVGKHFVTDQTYIFPLYTYSAGEIKKSNLNSEFITQIEETIGQVKPEEIFDYIYALLHSPNYREKYKEFLKIDFPRIPYPKDRKTFDALVILGGELRKYHLLEHSSINLFEIAYMGEGENEVVKPEYKDERIYINNEQYFGNVSEVAWNFYIGGYQPAQKWLKDRKGRKLENEEIEHYQKILISLRETDRLMKEIDKINY